MSDFIDKGSKFESNFISRFYLTPDQIYLPERYLTAIMRTSIFERVLTKYIFQFSSREFSLYEFLVNTKEDKKELEKFRNRMKYFQEIFTEETPLGMYGELAKELLTLIKEDFSKIQIDRFLLKMEFFLAVHFENNFYEEQVNTKMNENYFDNMYSQKGRTNFNYSIECLGTMLKFLKVFEKESLSTRIEDEFLNNNDLFCSEKIFYYYCDKNGIDKLHVGNVVEYLVEQLNRRIEALKDTKINDKQIENYITINLFVINKIVQDYSFYFNKKPDLETVFSSILPFKSWPLPIGNFCNEILENVISEASFQGITLLNRLREKYFIDLLDPSVIEIKTEDFNGVVTVLGHEWEKKKEELLHSENPKFFDLIRFFDRLRKRLKKVHNYYLNIRELICRILISFIYNSKAEYNNETLQAVYDNFYEDYQQYDKVDQDEESKNKEIDDKKNSGPKTKRSLEMLLKIIDTGFDKANEDFDKDINKVVENICGLKAKVDENKKEEDYNSLLTNNYLLPITAFRNYLRPQFSLLTKVGDPNEEGNVNFFEIYKKKFTHVVQTYFNYFLEKNDNPELEEIAKEKRKRFYRNYRISIVLIEETNAFKDFIATISKQNAEIASKITDQEFETFWKYFVDSKEEIEIKYLLYVLPNYDKYIQNPFRFIFGEDEIDSNDGWLSEFIAFNDNIYKSLVFLPWASKCDETFYSYFLNCQASSNNPLTYPSIDNVYSFLKKPLDYYLTDSKGLMQLNLYKLNLIHNGKIDASCVFWKNVKISARTAGISRITMKCVDIMGMETDKKKNIVLYFNLPSQVRLYNLFFKKDVPFNYNMTSNNGWLEMFLCDRYNPIETEKTCSYNYFVSNSSEGQFYEEYNVPLMVMESLFKNYKVMEMSIQCCKNKVDIVVDDTNSIKVVNKYPMVTDFTINISRYQENGKDVTIPISTFITI